MSNAPRAHSLSEIYYLLAVLPCTRCDRGPWQVQQVSTESVYPQTLAVCARCDACGFEKEFHFACDVCDGDSETALNPANQPSEIIDAGQWLTLHDLMTLQAQQAEEPAQAHRALCRATLCLEEALRFYDDDRELPGPEALFSHASDLAIGLYPQRFARSRLIEQHAKGRTPGPTGNEPGPKWWQFWREEKP